MPTPETCYFFLYLTDHEFKATTYSLKEMGSRVFRGKKKLPGRKSRVWTAAPNMNRTTNPRRNISGQTKKQRTDRGGNKHRPGCFWKRAHGARPRGCEKPYYRRHGADTPKGCLTPAEKYLATDADGIQLIKQVRAKLLENSSQMLTAVISDITGTDIISLHTDISTREGERVIIITFEQDLEKKYKGD